jgi:hypothetical protein
MKKNRPIVVLALIAAVCGISMLLIGPSHTLDVRLFYSQSEAHEWLASLTQAERSNYLTTEFFDVAYTLSYSAIFYLILGPIGLVPGILDLIETIPIILHLKNGNDLPAFLGTVSGIKWITGIVAFGFVVRKFVMNYHRSVQKRE